jgi:hypothetical protein
VLRDDERNATKKDRYKSDETQEHQHVVVIGFMRASMRAGGVDAKLTETVKILVALLCALWTSEYYRTR